MDDRRLQADRKQMPRSDSISARSLLETLENRRLLSGEPWGASGQLIRQNLAVGANPDLVGSGVVVAVIDTGIDYLHPALGSGFGPTARVIAGYDFADNDEDPRDTDGHGTAVAGVIAATPFAVNGFRYQGIAPDVKLVALRIAPDTSSVPLERISNALQWIIDRPNLGISVINVSFGFGRFTGDYSETLLSTQIAALTAAGVAIVCSSGNDGTADGFGIDYPAAQPDVFSVGAVDSSDVISEYTQRSENLDFLAVGTDVYSTFLNSTYAAVTGTSFAAPAIAGAIALARQIEPDFSLADVRSMLRASSRPNVDGDAEFGQTTALSFPRLDLLALVSIARQRAFGSPEQQESIGIAGNENDLAFDSLGVLHLVYYDAGDRTMKYATRSTTGQWSATTLIDDSGPDIGQYVSLAIDSMGKPNLAYFDGLRGDLKFGTFQGDVWQIATLEDRGSVGLYPSMLLDDAGFPYIAYYNRTRGDLRCASFDGTNWTLANIDTSGDVGRNVALAIGPDQRLAVAYEDSTTGRLKFARRAANLVWSRSIVDANTRGVSFISLAVDASSTPHISYYDATPADLKYATFPGSSWTTVTLANRGPVGLFTELSLEGDRPRILYYDRRIDALNQFRLESAGWVNVRVRDRGGRFLSCDKSPVDLACIFIATSTTLGSKLTVGVIEDMQ